MATDKLFTIAGSSTHNEETKLRFANDIARIKVLVKGGHTDIKLIQLPNAMTKSSAALYLKTSNEFQDAESQQLIDEYLEKNPAVEFKSASQPVVEDEIEDSELEPF